MRVGIFELVDPPPGQVEMVRQVVETSLFPWNRLIPGLRADPDQACVVRWIPDQMGNLTGKFTGATWEIHLGTRSQSWENRVDFVFAHECGHLVDRASLDDVERQAIIDLFHASPRTYRWNDVPQNGDENPWSHDQPHNEDWRGGNDYLFAHHEAWADAFVEAFCPQQWMGPGWMRFIHSTGDLEAVRRIVLERKIPMFSDIEGHALEADIEWAAEQGLVTGKADGSFAPNEPVTRAQLCAVLHRQASG